VSYSTCAVKIHNATNSLNSAFWKQKFLSTMKNALAYHNAVMGILMMSPKNKSNLMNPFLKKKVARAGERTRDLLISFIFSFHHLTAEPQRLPMNPFCFCAQSEK
jgi:hypothetical protein